MDAAGTPSLARHAPAAAIVAGRIAPLAFQDLPADVVALARLCLLDTLGTTLAGAFMPQAEAVLAAVGDETGPARLLGRVETLAPRAAALVNGTAGHALDYDDCNLRMPGHVSVAVVPALLALADAGAEADGGEVLAAIVAGHEAGCLLGEAIAPGHYAQGFHATGTLGTVAAAGAAARLLGLDAERTTHALALAMTMAAGLKGAFGTMAKPMHAGKAAENGLLAARLAAAGATTRPDLFERPQGFAATHAPLPPRPVMPDGFEIRHNLFKHHAACYGTIAPIECAAEACAGVAPEGVERIVLATAETNRNTCSIPLPTTAAEACFSLAHCVAMAACGHDTASPAAYGETLADRRVAAVRERVEIVYLGESEITLAEITVHLADGGVRTARFDAGVPVDPAADAPRLEAKFRALAAPVVGAARAEAIVAAIAALDPGGDVRDIVTLCAGGAR